MCFIKHRKGKPAKEMGLAASQARLLSITARMHDVEFQAQAIMNQKIELATQQDAAYQDYCDALDAKRIQVAFRNGTATKYVDATFKNVCAFDETGNRKCQYALTDANTGKMIVEQDVYENYQDYENDKYSFAWAMLGFVESGDYSDFSWSDNWGNNVGANAGVGDSGADGHTLLLMTDAEKIVFDKHSDDTALSGAFNEYNDALESGDLKKQKEAIENFRKILYKNSTWKAEIYDAMRLDKGQDKDAAINNNLCIDGFPEDFDETMSAKFEYYVRIFEGIENAGGCIPISEFCDGDNLNNEWFNGIIKSGRALLNIYNNNGPDKGWKETSIATDTSENFLQENTDDADIRKAEAKYEHELNKIKQKDAKYDKDLQKLETERTALNTEMDSIKKVKDDNIERTFGIFS